MTDRRTVRLMCDYHATWPLWDDVGAKDPSEPDVSEGLATRLCAWQESFEQGFHYEHGWSSAEEATAYAEEGRELRRLLTAEIGEWVDVQLDLWPVTTERDPLSPEASG